MTYEEAVKIAVETLKEKKKEAVWNRYLFRRGIYTKQTCNSIKVHPRLTEAIDVLKKGKDGEK